MRVDFRFSPDGDESKGFASVRLEADEAVVVRDVRLSLNAPTESEDAFPRRMEIDIPVNDWIVMCRAFLAATGNG